MKSLLLILYGIQSAHGITVSEAYRPLDLREVNKPVYCMAPSQPFFENKLRSNYHIEAGERELREIIRDQRNYNSRVEVKSLRRQTIYAGRLDRVAFQKRTAVVLDQMIEVTGRQEPIVDFPVLGASSRIASTDNGTLMITMENLSKPELDFLPKPIKDRFGNSVIIRYDYPLDKFEYYISYNNEELPLNKALHLVQDDFEDVCIRGALENREIRDRREKNQGPRAGGAGAI